MNLLQLRGFKDNLKVQESHWHTFRMLFGSLLVDSLNGMITYSHDFVKEAVQSLLLGMKFFFLIFFFASYNAFNLISIIDGFSVELNKEYNDSQINKALIPKHNLSFKQTEMHLYIIFDLVSSRMQKNQFYECSNVFLNNENDDASSRYFENIGELLSNLFMVNDLKNIIKILSNYRWIY